MRATERTSVAATVLGRRSARRRRRSGSVAALIGGAAGETDRRARLDRRTAEHCGGAEAGAGSAQRARRVVRPVRPHCVTSGNDTRAGIRRGRASRGSGGDSCRIRCAGFGRDTATASNRPRSVRRRVAARHSARRAALDVDCDGSGESAVAVGATQPAFSVVGGAADGDRRVGRPCCGDCHVRHHSRHHARLRPDADWRSGRLRRLRSSAAAARRQYLPGAAFGSPR